MGGRPRDVQQQPWDDSLSFFTVILRPPKDLAVLPYDQGLSNIA